MNALAAAKMYDSLPPGQTMTRQAFIAQAVILTDPDAYHRDTQSLLTMRGTAQAERTKIEIALKQKGGI